MSKSDGPERAGIRAAKDIEIGVHVETPAAVVIADRLARVQRVLPSSDHDLTQYPLR